MIYATMCIGSEWCEKYYNSINTFAETETVHILTDNPTYFPNCINYTYNRDVFSYYEKLNHIMTVSSKLKKRITYVDADWLSKVNTNLEYDDMSLYCYYHYNLIDTDFIKVFGGGFKEKIKPLLSKVGLNTIGDGYIPEAFISFPYLNNIQDISQDISILQDPLEKMFSTSDRTRTDKYVADGKIGYGEGWSLTILCEKYNINIIPTNWRKTELI
jgi:hypothetical protein